MSIPCPHCSAPTLGEASFCTSCGKALPGAGAGPRVLGFNDMARSEAGQSLQMDQLGRHMRTGSRTLMVLAILQLAFAALFGFLSIVAPADVDPEAVAQVRVGAVLLGALGGTFFGLAMWARRSPLPATLTGLTLYGTLIGAGILMNPQSVSPLSLIIQAAVILCLARAVSAGIKHRALKREIEVQQASGARVAEQPFRAAA